jgi:hypothetical protein
MRPVRSNFLRGSEGMGKLPVGHMEKGFFSETVRTRAVSFIRDCRILTFPICTVSLSLPFTSPAATRALLTC